MYGLDIYQENGGYIGKAQDLILNLEAGELVRITTEPLNTMMTREDLPKILQHKSVMFKRVKSVGDIIIVGKGAMAEAEAE